MKIEILYSSYPQLIAEFRQKGWVSLRQDEFGLQTDWKAPFMVGRNRSFDLSPDLKIYDWRQTLLEDLEFVERGTELSPVALVFLIQGHLQGSYQDSTYVQNICVEPGHNLLMFTGLGKRGVWKCPQTLQNETVEVAIDAKRLIDYLGDEPVPALVMLRQLLSQQSEQPYFHTGATTPAMQMVLHQYLHCPFEGAMRRIYLESKAVELVALKLSQIKQMAQDAKAQRDEPLARRSLKTKDVERVHHAREILIKDIANPPSLQQLAEQIGIGDYKLKRDFRQAFGTTVFGYLRSHRLECARQLLTAQRMNVSEAAEFVGYGSLSKFTAAFKRQFGILPSACAGKRKVGKEKSALWG